MSAARLVVAAGAHGSDRLWLAAGAPPGAPAEAVAFLLGDRVESAGVAPGDVALQEPAALAAALRRRFPAAAIAVIAPSRLEAGRACYDHFLPGATRTGEPGPGGYAAAAFRAAEQLGALLRAAGVFSQMSGGGAALPPLRVLAFSKAGVVANQLLAEAAAAGEAEEAAACGGGDESAATAVPQPPEAAAFLLRALREVHFLDVGLNRRGAYLTDPRAFAALGRALRRARAEPSGAAALHSTLRVVLHGTPRQWADPARCFLAEERDQMAALAERAGVPCEVQRYFEGEEPSLKMHFAVIEAAEYGD
jgi:hypothetical protein